MLPLLILESEITAILEDFVLPALIVCSVCVVLPVLLVWLKSSNKKLEMENRTRVMLAAIEKGMDVDMSLLKKESSVSSYKWWLFRTLKAGLVLLLLGGAFLLCWDDMGTPMPSYVCFGLGLAFVAIFFAGKWLFRQELREESRKASDASDRPEGGNQPVQE